MAGTYGGSSVYSLISKEWCKDTFSSLKDLIYLDCILVDLNYNGFDNNFVTTIEKLFPKIKLNIQY